MSPLSPLDGHLTPALDAFQTEANRGEAVRVSVDGHDYQVRAEGTLEASTGVRRQVTWVESDADTTTLFVNALSAGFGAGLSTAVAQELGLSPAPGQALASRRVQQAMEMAQTGKAVLSGVDFLTQFEHSAVVGGVAFKRAADAEGIDPSLLGPEVRAELDRKLQSRFEQALASGQSPVEPAAVTTWVRHHLAQLKAST